jgi:hypothetical protein
LERPENQVRRVRVACDDCDTILGKHDFVVIVRRWRHRGSVRHSGVWTPAGVVGSRELAEAMAEILRDESGTEVRALSTNELLHKVRDEDRERILDRLNSRTTAEITRDLELQRAAALVVAGTRDRRSGDDRRSGHDRRSRRDGVPARAAMLTTRERRSGSDRRSGRDRRRRAAA